jgi:succinoglycan biosynthesis protein ExoO
MVEPAPTYTDTPTVTIAVACYNAAPFLQRAVRSALAQTLSAFEVLIVNDASTDQTLEVANELSLEDPRIRIISLSNNLGPSGARNAALAAARGQWFAILDADDAYLPSRLQHLHKIALKDPDLDIVVDNFLFYDAIEGQALFPALSVIEGFRKFNLYDFVEHAHPYTADTDWGLLKPLFRRSFLIANQLRYPEFSRHGEDFLLMFEALKSYGRALLVWTPGYLYSTRSSGLSRTTINYAAMIDHTAALMTDARTLSDPRLMTLLNTRIRALKRWSIEYHLRTMRENRDYLGLARLLACDSNVAARALRSVTSRIFKSSNER